jgi:hypothetical protein
MPEADPKVANNLARFRDWVKGWAAGATVVRSTTHITVETAQLLIVQQRVIHAWCSQCGCHAEFVDGGVAQTVAAAWAATSDPGAEMHTARGRDGTELVCLRSLSGRPRGS